MAGKFSRDKGKRAEREVIGMLDAICTEVYKAHKLDPPLLQRNTLQSDGGGFDIVGLEWLALEVKHAETLELHRWWAQTLAQAGPGRIPVLLYRQSRTPWKARMPGCLWTGVAQMEVPVTVEAETFLTWFRRRLNHQLHLLGER